MLENCNKHSPPKRPYFDRSSTCNGTQNLQEYQQFFLKATEANKVLIIRRFGNRPGGIGKISTTREVLEFLEYHKGKGAPKPYCQLQGQCAAVKEHDDLLGEFRKVPSERTYVANVLGFPLMHSPFLQKQIAFPDFLNDLDLLQHTAESANDFHQSRTKAKAPVDCGFAVVSMQGSFTTFHLDKLSTFVVLSEGFKVWAFFPDSEKNRKAREKWRELNGLSVFEDWFVVDSHPGDLVLIPCGWHHAVYTVTDSLMLGGHYLVPEQLQTNLAVATRLKTCAKGSRNDSLKELREYFSALNKVQMFRALTD
jgi:hypothetical protein